MNIRQVSAICLSIAATHFVYAASNVANPVNDSSQTKGIIKNQYIVILNKDAGPSKDFAKILLNNMLVKFYKATILFLKVLQFIYLIQQGQPLLKR